MSSQSGVKLYEKRLNRCLEIHTNFSQLERSA